ncbi:hypothetical protein, partial [Klebsiella pneumoniae]|uniref:hypothetical protein n=1 Tax=Klebsiella pneumoniae TaxID=573 RepID=UPI001C3E7569
FTKNIFINQKQKSKIQKQSNTIIIPTINNTNPQSNNIYSHNPPNNITKNHKSLNSKKNIITKLKLKKINKKTPPKIKPTT